MRAYEERKADGEQTRERERYTAGGRLAEEESEKDPRLDRRRSPSPGASSPVVAVADDDDAAAAPVLVASRRPGPADLAR